MAGAAEPCKSQPRGGLRRAAQLLLTAAVLAGCLLPLAAQPVPPLKGQGRPHNSTTDVYLSLYLDRLLEVDEKLYRHEMVTFFYITWRDDTAYDTVQASTATWLAGNTSCVRECTDHIGRLSCCDGIYMPSFFFRNAHSFPEDRGTAFRLVVLPAPNNSVAWTSFVHGIYFQPLDLSHFPFDSYDLLIQLELQEASSDDHPGITVHASSGGTTLYTQGGGDAASQWSVQGIEMKVTQAPADLVALFQKLSTLPSAPGDPLGLTNTNASYMARTAPAGTARDTPTAPMTGVRILIRVARFSSYHLLNTVLPVLLLGLLSFVVFFLERADLSSRLSIVVTLFLAMAAVQFVISDSQPASSYIMPTQQAALATYMLLTITAVESIVVYRLETWQDRKVRDARRWAARRRYLEHCRAEAAAEAAADAEMLPIRQSDAVPQGASPGKPAIRGDGGGDGGSDGSSGSGIPDGELAAAAAAATLAANGSAGAAQPVAAATATPPSSSGGVRFRLFGFGGGGGGTRRGRQLYRDREYDAWFAYMIDRLAFAVLAVAYCTAIVLIFVLQSGYIELFP